MPICEGYCSGYNVHFYWHHYKINDYCEQIQFIANMSVNGVYKTVGQISIFAYRNVMARKYQFPELGYTYSRSKVDLAMFKNNMKFTAYSKYESFYEPNGLTAAITSFDVIPQFRKKYIGSALLYIAVHSMQDGIALIMNPNPYNPVIPLSDYRAEVKLSAYSIGKIQEMCKNYGFRLEQTRTDDRIVQVPVSRLILDSKVPTNAHGFKLIYNTKLDNYRFKISKQREDRLLLPNRDVKIF